MIINKEVASNLWKKIMTDKKTKVVAVNEWGEDPDFTTYVASLYGAKASA
jgi:hypothetical protein